MTRLAVSVAMLATFVTASTAHAQEMPEDVQAVADAAGVDAQDLLGAVYTTGLDAKAYECMADGLFCPPKPTMPAHNALADCIVSHESNWNPRAVNPRSGAAGLGQFLASTWRTTPQGRAGLSVFDPSANYAAVVYMLNVGRGSEFVGIRGCR